MGQTLRSIWKLLALAGLLASLLAIPAIGQEDLPADGETIRLHLGSDGKYFRHSDPSIDDQPIPDPVRCELGNRVAGPLAFLSANNRGPGLVDISIGVKTGGAQGTPCGRVDPAERLTLTLGDGYFAEAASFDLELKGSAEVELRLSNGETFTVRTGSTVVPGVGEDSTPTDPFLVTVTSANPIANCQGQADSGPDAGSRDNCYVTVIPSSTFNEVIFAPKSGEMSLEGSGDFGNNPDFDTIFYLSQFEGELDCGDEVTHVDGDVTGTIIRHDNVDGSDCVLKPYTLVASASDETVETGHSVTFDIAPDGQQAAYEAFITLPGDLSNPTGAELQWSTEPPFATFELMKVCVDEPFVGTTINVAALGGEDGCIISVSQDWTGNTVWHVIFIADPKFY